MGGDQLVGAGPTVPGHHAEEGEHHEQQEDGRREAEAAHPPAAPVPVHPQGDDRHIVGSAAGQREGDEPRGDHVRIGALLVEAHQLGVEFVLGHRIVQAVARQDE